MSKGLCKKKEKEKEKEKRNDLLKIYSHRDTAVRTQLSANEK